MNRVLPFALIVFLAACETTDYSRITRTESFHEEKILEKGLVFIQPEVEFYEFIDEDVKREFSKEGKLNTILLDAYRYVGKKQKTNYRVVELGETGLDNAVMHELLGLKRNIRDANRKQVSALNQGLSESTASLFASQIRILPDYNNLENTFKTPYFVVSGIVSYNTKNGSWAVKADYGHGVSNYHYMLVVNIETSTLVYRELRQLPLQLNRSTIYPSVYNAMNRLKNNL